MGCGEDCVRIQHDTTENLFHLVMKHHDLTKNCDVSLKIETRIWAIAKKNPRKL